MRSAAVLRALPALLRIGFADAVAYRAEFLIWVLSTTMPFVMLLLWSAVAEDAPVGRFGQVEFAAYFLATFVVRQLGGAWVSWELNHEVRHGTLSMRLLRPVPPVIAYATEGLAALPLRIAACLPVALLGLVFVGTGELPDRPAMWLAWLAAMAGGWLISFLASFGIGCLAFFVESSLKVMNVWLALFFVFSGYLVPVELFPPLLGRIADWMPFRYQVGLPVELLTSAHAPAEAVTLLLRQWSYVAVLALVAAGLWRAGVKRYAAYGG